MNYLAHLYLSGNSEEQLIGNLLGDHVKGIIKDQFSEEVRKGLILHRKIDSYTNSHSLAQANLKLFTPDRRRFAGIIMDVCYDHFLIKNWSNYSSIELHEFISNVHHILQNHKQFFIGRLKFLLCRKTLEHLLGTNGSMEGIEFTLDRISNRMKRGDKLRGALEEIEENYDAFELSFSGFFPDLIHYCDSTLESQSLNLN